MFNRQSYESALNDHENAFRNVTKTHRKSLQKRIDLKIDDNQILPLNTSQLAYYVQSRPTSDEEISDSACSDKTVGITVDGRSHAVSVTFLLQAVHKIWTASACV